MDPAKRIIVNTIAQYVKAVINICLALYSTRLILHALSISDYGIYSVVGGVVSMLGFITNALIITTQRYISFHHGRGDRAYVRKLFSNSLLLHWGFGLAIALVLLLIKDWLMDSVLNIDPARISTAEKVYVITIGMLLITILTAPFKALFIARENIVYVAVVDIIDGVVKLLMAIGLAYVNADKLLVYAFMMAAIQLLNLAAYALYGRLRFEECHLFVHRREIDRQTLSQLAGFAGWTTYGMASIAARNQGIAVAFNHFFGTVINAAYGVAMQINNAIFFVSSSIVNAMNPQIMRAEGSADRVKVLKLASQESKFSTVLLAIVSIPLLMELPQILAIWLVEVPADTAMLCVFTLGACLCDQLTIGLNAVNQAMGNIKTYSLLMFTPKLLNLPIAFLLLYWGYPIASVMWSVLLIELLVALARLPYLRRTAGLSVKTYLHETLLPLVPLFVVLLVVSWACTQLFHFPFRFLLTVTLSILAGIATAWKFTLTSGEKEFVLKMLKEKLKR